LIRDELVSKHAERPDAPVVGTITLVYDHHQRMLGDKLTGLQHAAFHNILSSLHVHLDHDNCLEVIVVKGRSREVRKIADSLDHDHLGGGVVICGTGVDLCEVPRIRASAERYGERFINRIYTPGEIAYVSRKANKFERYAARFAAKEAGMKALGTGWRRGVTWHDFEVRNMPGGRPTLLLHGAAERIAAELGVRRISLSLTHTAEYGQAYVIFED
jgi:holo-[acyl-carrier protein] synthase